ncbi:TPA: hypothetical protein EYP26_02690 [Candidatus Bathyarchaeota archaeon]|nr:hypothetical protein [Candidatus Bathyarchaeota archaeon]
MPYCPVCDRNFKADYVCPQCGSTMLPRAGAGFVVSLAAGVWILVCGLFIFIFWSTISPFIIAILGIYSPSLAALVATYGTVIVTIGILSGLMIVVGGVLIYLPGKEYAGAALVLTFSLISLAIAGGLLIGVTLGVTGAALGFAKK